MAKFYFTFGSWKGFPFQNTYVTVVANSEKEAIATFRSNYPDRTPDTVNCSDWYSQEEWDMLQKKGYMTVSKEPAAVLTQGGDL